MASLIYNKFLDNVVRGAFNFASDTFKVMLVTSSYTPNKDTHEDRADVTNEVSGTGYTAGGTATTPTITLDTSNDRVDLTFSNVSWASATITARAAVIYKSTGTASTDLLVAYVDFGSDVSSTNAAFAVTFSSALRFQN
jgi:hypothetical protein